MLALAVAAAVGLWVGLWPVAALALGGLVAIGRREPIAAPIDAIVFLGLAGRAEPVWVAALIAASWIAGDRDPRSTLILLIASFTASFVLVDWTVLTALLTLIGAWRAVRLLRRPRATA